MKRRGSHFVGVLVSVCLLGLPSLASAQGNSPGGSGLAQQLAALQAQMTAAETRLTSAETRLSSAEARLSSAEGRLSAAETAVSTLTTQSANQAGQIAALQAKAVSVGTIITYAAETPPPGYLECDGTEVLRADYPALFTAIGTAWGEGDGASTFKVPDLRGLFQRGWSHGSPMFFDFDRAARGRFTTGAATGDHVGSYQTDVLANHSHLVQSATLNPFGAFSAVAGGNAIGSALGITIGTGGGGNETRPKNVSVMYAIKY